MTCSRSFALKAATEPQSSYAAPSDTDWLAGLARSFDQPDVRDAMQSISAEEFRDYYNRLSPEARKDIGSLEEFTALIKAHWALNGSYVERLAGYVDIMFNKLIGEPWDPVPLGMLPTRSFNASVVAANDGKAILLNYGFVRNLRMFWKAFLGFASYGQTPPEPEPMCIHLELFDFAISMAVEVAVQKTGVNYDWPEVLAPQTCGYCAADHWEQYADGYIVLSELFVIFHEIAHITLGHLDSLKATTAMESQHQEYAADEWAVRHLLSASADDRMHANNVALCAGIFLVFAELIGEARNSELQTHPIPAMRRVRVNELCGVSTDDGSAAGELNSLVDQVYPLCSVTCDFVSSLLKGRVMSETLAQLTALNVSIRESGIYSDATHSLRRAFWGQMVTRSGNYQWHKAP